VSCLEVATLARRRRIGLDRTPARWVAAALGGPAIEASAVTPEIAVAAGSLPDDFPGDPADRLIYATAIAAGAALVTRDATIRRFDPRRTVW
jgi:PIN domain nuclease of toxin-antitoxin system